MLRSLTRAHRAAAKASAAPVAARALLSTAVRAPALQQLSALVSEPAGAHFDAVVLGAGIGGVAAAVGITSPAITRVTLDTVPVDVNAAPSSTAAAVVDLTTPAGERKRVLVLESEGDFCFHSTGRSAAIYSEVYGSPAVRALSTATKPFYYAHAASGLVSETPLAVRRPALHVTNDPAQADIKTIYAESAPLVPSLRHITPAEAVDACPWLIGATEDFLHRGEPASNLDAEETEKRRAAVITGALLEPDAATMDVDAIWTSMTKLARGNGAAFVKGAAVTDATVDAASNRWTLKIAPSESNAVSPNAGETVSVTTDLVVNASGAWADTVASKFGVAPVGITPMRRTIIQFDPADVAPAFPAAAGFADKDAYLRAQGAWPAVFDAHDTYYYKPESGRVLASPADETPTEPCDAQPDDWDIAVCVDRLNDATPFRPRKVAEKWAGLRCFATDREFVIGEDASAKGFFWMAGLGGYGIQTAMGNAKLIAGLVHEGKVPQELKKWGFDESKISPNRFRK